MINESSDKMMHGAPKEKKMFHFAGDGIYSAKAIFADTQEEAEQVWLETRQLISQSNSEVAAPPEEKVEDKSTDTI